MKDSTGQSLTVLDITGKCWTMQNNAEQVVSAEHATVTFKDQ
jgi:hypothetical protein